MSKETELPLGGHLPKITVILSATAKAAKGKPGRRTVAFTGMDNKDIPHPVGPSTRAPFLSLPHHVFVPIPGHKGICAKWNCLHRDPLSMTKSKPAVAVYCLMGYVPKLDISKPTAVAWAGAPKISHKASKKKPKK
jgi:hypothetical protein